MLKFTLTTLLSRAIAGVACAQSDTSVYYLRKTGPTVVKGYADYYKQELKSLKSSIVNL